MTEVPEFSTAQIKAINEGAARAYAVGRGLVEMSDCQQEAWLWVYENLDTVRKWEDTNRRHDKLKTACYHAGLLMIRATMRANGGTERRDFATYATAVIQDLLPAVFLGATFQTGDEVNEEIRHKTTISEGGVGVAMVADVKAAFQKLTDDQKEILFRLHADGEATYDSVATAMDMTPSTLRRREQRALEAIVDRLGGPRVEARRRNGVRRVS